MNIKDDDDDESNWVRGTFWTTKTKLKPSQNIVKSNLTELKISSGRTQTDKGVKLERPQNSASGRTL